MKWLFLLLLLINAGIFAWGYQHERIDAQPAIEAGADVGDMRLISELEQEEKQKAAAPAAQAEAEIVIAKAEQPDMEHISAAEEQTEQEDTAEAAAPKKTPASNVITTEESASKPEMVAKAEPAAEIKPQEKEQAEQPEQQVAAKDKPAPQPEPKERAQPEPGTVTRCGVIGPLKDRQVAKGVLDDLKKSELEAKLERKIEKEQIGYWVVIPPLPDGSQAQAKIDELAQVGLKDIWHFRGGGMKNAISLGMFAQKENAEKLSEAVLKKGFKTEMRPRYLNKTRYLVKFSIAKTKTVTDNMWQDVEQKYSRMPFSEQPCESIATR